LDEDTILIGQVLAEMIDEQAETVEPDEPVGAADGPADDMVGANGLLYAECGGKTFRISGDPDHPQLMFLADFTARISREIHRIENGHPHLEYEITATHPDGSTATSVVPADKYAKMEWPEALGAKYVVAAGRGVRDHLRCAVQMLTERDGAIPRDIIRTATGWTEIDGRVVFLHGRGAIGADGTIPVQVELGGNLKHIELPVPPTDPSAIAAAIEAVFAIAELGQDTRPASRALAAVMLGLPWRAIIAGSFPTTIQFSGPRETFKTESAMIVSRFFRGAVADDEHRKARLVAADWKTGSAKGISRLLADAANTVVLVDELTDREAVTKATAVVQSLFNAGNDVKLTASRAFAATFTPQAALLTCGEAELDRQSTRSRMLTIRMTRQTVAPAVLSRLQQLGAEGQFAAATAGFVRWLAHPDRFSSMKDQFWVWAREHGDKLRNSAGFTSQRPVEAVCELYAAFRSFGRFAVDVGAVKPAVLENYLALVESGLASLAASQSEVVREAETGELVLELIRTGFLTGRYYLAAHDGTDSPPAHAAEVGWRKVGKENDGNPEVPHGSRPIGWSGHIPATSGGCEACAFFNPPALQSAIVTIARETGVPYENPKMIARDLVLQGIAIPGEEKGEPRYTIVRKIASSSKRVIAIPLSRICQPGSA
jgi:hypothetical protein